MKVVLTLFALVSAVLSFAGAGTVPDSASQVYTLGEVDQAPKLMLKMRLVYPPELKGQRVTGEVTIECVVDLEGSVRDPKVISSSRQEFELPALQSVVKWKYKPGRKAKKPVNVRQEIVIQFEAKK